MFHSMLEVFKKWPFSWTDRKQKMGEVQVPYFGPLNDKQIAQLAEQQGFIQPFEASNVRTIQVPFGNEIYGGKRPVGAVSFGTSSFGYDFTLAEDVRLLRHLSGEVINVKAFDLDKHTEPLEIKQDEYGKYVVMPPHSFVLGHTVEHVRMPDDVVGLCFDKSTYARVGGIQTNVTPLEPGWEGQITLEIRNTLPAFTRLYVGEGIIQTVFFRGMRPALTYAEKRGKYQGQQGITGAKV
jgi:dCTP deaminase